MTPARFDRDPSRRTLAVFGVLLVAFFGLLGALVRARTGSEIAARVLWIAGASLGLLYAAFVALRWPIYMAWMTAAMPLGEVVSRLLLGIVYFGVVTPLGLVMRAFGYDPMRRRARGASNWVEIEPESDPGRAFRQS